MTDDNLDDVQPEKLAWLYDKEARVLRHRETWNAAIEAAAQKINEEMGDDETDTYYIEREIRKLKK